ncbi:MAG TPA: UdgX family uracil-DNA binding protein [Acidisarcina sp.]|nr:UdgX family uracil-DNA binding protein [Acidisarcina sp.]
MTKTNRSPHSAAEYLPRDRSLGSLQEAVQSCHGCALYLRATQAVFGEGLSGASLFFIGEQPGDHEDLGGRPFVGPAGRLLDHCLREAGIDRDRVYLTNAVKHFKWTPRGSRRIHEKPRGLEMQACKPWLEAEIAAIRPRLLICLGATAAQIFFGRDYRITEHRGDVMQLAGLPPIFITIHPSAVLRITGDQDRRRELESFIRDLTKVAALVREKAA